MKTLIVALQKNSTLVSATYELIEAAKQLGGEIVTVVMAADASAIANELATRGGGKVLAVSHAQLNFFNDEIYANVLADIIGKEAPHLVLAPASFYGKALGARLAAKLGAPMASDVKQIVLDGETVTAVRPQYGGSVVSSIVANNGGPFVVTVRPKVYPESKDGAGEVAVYAVDETLMQAKMTIKEVKAESGGAVNLTEADVIVAAGRGLKAAEHLPMVQELASSLHAAFGASRAIVDAGWTAYSNQVGQTGKTVNPKLYIAVGISGAIQHLVGMSGSGTIVAVNKDKDAPIFNVSTYGIVGDAFEIVPALTNKFKAELAG